MCFLFFVFGFFFWWGWGVVVGGCVKGIWADQAIHKSQFYWLRITVRCCSAEPLPFMFFLSSSGRRIISEINRLCLLEKQRPNWQELINRDAFTTLFCQRLRHHGKYKQYMKEYSRKSEANTCQRQVLEILTKNLKTQRYSQFFTSPWGILKLGSCFLKIPFTMLPFTVWQKVTLLSRSNWIR